MPTKFSEEMVRPGAATPTRRHPTPQQVRGHPSTQRVDEGSEVQTWQHE
eukprot:CAMPEP_0194477322 /NCGR_PEP_ID=MMETSP0253-20130528/1096_1 /TAXON_ID=2966 /ORGANISM="Noctiluca scintillans" /LENGTH=48 /DNA_ID= /DNA_START= /DNA_END= /DNA_ORIENTATION=